MKKHINIDGMLLATFLTTIFYSSTYPYIHKEVMMVATDTFIALNQIINCVSVVIFGWLWNKKSEKLFNFYPVFCVLETTLGIMTTAYAIITHNISNKKYMLWWCEVKSNQI